MPASCCSRELFNLARFESCVGQILDLLTCIFIKLSMLEGEQLG